MSANLPTDVVRRGNAPGRSPGTGASSVDRHPAPTAAGANAVPSALARTLSVLEQSDIRWALLRGEAELGSPGGDVDVLVATGDFPRLEGELTQLRITLSEPVEAHAQLMESPDRVIVDLPEVAFHLAAENGKKREGVIASYRYGLFAPGRSRESAAPHRPPEVCPAGR